jgi:carboxypeptidase D
MDQYQSNVFMSSSSTLVKSLPGLHGDNYGQSYAGYIDLEDGASSQMFYWLFKAKSYSTTSSSTSDEKPLIIWLNGGPGCSSMIGQFLEVGPLMLTPDGKIEENIYSWTNVADVLFVDQPLGTGLSHTQHRSCNDDRSCNSKFYDFLIHFFRLYKEYVSSNHDGTQRTNRIIIAGESHAGHFIPSFVDYLLEKNEGNAKLFIDIDHLVVGNGWVDPSEQYDVSDYAYVMKMITLKEKEILQKKASTCRASLRKSQYNTRICYRLLDDVLDMTSMLKTRTGRKKPLSYDIRQFVNSEAFYPPGHARFERYMNRPDVRKALHATNTPHKFIQCADPPYFALKHQDGKGVLNELSSILRSGVKVTLFTGMYDLVCNYISLEKGLRKLDWKGKGKWETTPVYEWDDAGWFKTLGPLTSIIFTNAGHMVAMDQKEKSLEMIRKIVERKDFPKVIEADSTGLYMKVFDRVKSSQEFRKSIQLPVSSASQRRMMTDTSESHNIDGRHMNYGMVVGLIILLGIVFASVTKRFS